MARHGTTATETFNAESRFGSPALSWLGESVPASVSSEPVAVSGLGLEGSGSAWEIERTVSKAERPLVVWLTGLRKSGTSTLAVCIERRLRQAGRLCCVLDDARLRQRLNRDLSLSVVGHAEAVRRTAEVARLMVDAGLIVICTSCSPYRAIRHGVRAMFDDGEFLEIHVSTPLQTCIERDASGLYDLAARGLASDVPGIHIPFEDPEAPDLRLSAAVQSPEQLSWRVIQLLRERGTAC